MSRWVANFDRARLQLLPRAAILRTLSRHTWMIAQLKGRYRGEAEKLADRNA